MYHLNGGIGGLTRERGSTHAGALKATRFDANEGTDKILAKLVWENDLMPK